MYTYIGGIHGTAFRLDVLLRSRSRPVAKAYYAGKQSVLRRRIVRQSDLEFVFSNDANREYWSRDGYSSLCYAAGITMTQLWLLGSRSMGIVGPLDVNAERWCVYAATWVVVVLCNAAESLFSNGSG